MLSNKTYLFIVVSLTLREGKCVHQPCSKSSEKVQQQEHLPILFRFTLVLPKKRNELLHQLRKKETCV